jgi:hypothetical protein
VTEVRTEGGIEFLVGIVRSQEPDSCAEAACALWRCAERGLCIFFALVAVWSDR